MKKFKYETFLIDAGDKEHASIVSNCLNELEKEGWRVEFIETPFQNGRIIITIRAVKNV